MFVIIAQFQIKPGYRDPLVEALLEDGRSSVKDEPGCYQFEVIQDETDPNIVRVHEVYADAAAFDAHLQTPHLKKWRETSNDWIEGRVVYRGSTVFPDDSYWKNS